MVHPLARKRSIPVMTEDDRPLETTDYQPAGLETHSISFLERALYLKRSDTLVVSDLHFGRGAASNVDAPLDDDGDTLSRLESLVSHTCPETVVVAGDCLHAFSTLPHGVDWSVTRLERLVADADADLVITLGNHDGMLESVYDGPRPNLYRPASQTVVCHGHEPPELGNSGHERPELEGNGHGRSELGDGGNEHQDLETSSDRPTLYVVGHDHPALSIGGRKRPCVLFGPGCVDGADVLMLPAFTKSAAGMTVNRLRGSDFQCPLVTNPDRWHPGVYDTGLEGVRWFPSLGQCRSLL